MAFLSEHSVERFSQPFLFRSYDFIHQFFIFGTCQHTIHPISVERPREYSQYLRGQANQPKTPKSPQLDYSTSFLRYTRGGNKFMKIEMTPQQVSTNVELLTRLADLYSTEAAGLARLDFPVARELAEERLDMIGYAQELIALLSDL